MEEKSKNKIQERMNDYFDESINSNNYRSEQTKERLNMRKNKIFNLLFSKRKEGIEGFVNGPNEIDINEINCNENIKKDVNNYLKTEYDIKKWFKYIFSSNKNEIYLALFLLRRYIELQVIELKDNKRMLSRNDTELIQKLCDNLLKDDLKIAYNSCACLSNLTFFPEYIEKRIYSEKNLEKILKFFDIITKNISSYTYKSLFLFLNIATNENVKIYLVKHNFLESLYDFMKNIINGQIKFVNDISELETIKNCIKILYQLILVCEYIDNNYMNNFVQFIPFLKIMTNKYFVNIDNIAFDEEECTYVIILWKIYTKLNDDNNIIINEIIKDNFIQVLIQFYKKFKNIEQKLLFTEIFIHFSSIDICDKILINDGMLDLLKEEIEKYQYSNVNLLKKLIFCCSNLTLGNIGENKTLIKLGIIYKIMDITIFYIDDKLDDEIIELLKYCLVSLIQNIGGIDREIKKQIIVYKNNLIIKIFCKALKLDLEQFSKNKIIQNIIVLINDLSVISEELDTETEKQYDITCISNSLVEILNNILNKPNLEPIVINTISDILALLKDKEENI